MKILHVIFYIICFIISGAFAQTCPDGFPAAFKCVPSKKSKGEYYCKGDEKLGCEIINGDYFCCDNKEGKNEVPTDSNATLKPSVGKISKDTEATTKKQLKIVTTLAPKKLKATTKSKNKVKKVEESDEEERVERTTPASPCLDQGTECRIRSQLCSNPLYEPLMRQQCPKTCHFCHIDLTDEHNKTEKNDEDKEDKRNCEDRGPDCAESRELCENPYYIEFMQLECCSTCRANKR